MYCPACGRDNPVGSERCRKCGTAFTLAATYHDGYRPEEYAIRPSAGDGPRYGQARPGGRSRTITISAILMLILAVAIGAIIGARMISDSVIKPAVSDRVAGDLNQGIRAAVQQELNVPDGAAPAEQITITESDVNEGVDKYNLGPINSANVNLAPEGISVDLKAYGFSGTYRSDLAVQDGNVVLKNGRVSGPLSFVVPAEDLEQTANEALSGALNDAGYRVGQVTLGEGTLTIVQE